MTRLIQMIIATADSLYLSIVQRKSEASVLSL